MAPIDGGPAREANEPELNNNLCHACWLFYDTSAQSTSTMYHRHVHADCFSAMSEGGRRRERPGELRSRNDRTTAHMLLSGIDSPQRLRRAAASQRVDRAVMVCEGAAMPIEATRDRVIKALQSMPPDVSYEDVIERIVFLAKIEEGLAQLDAEQGVPHEEAKRRLGL